MNWKTKVKTSQSISLFPTQEGGRDPQINIDWQAGSKTDQSANITAMVSISVFQILPWNTN